MRKVLFYRLKASFTVEAALVMNIVLLTMVSMILRCFSLHDEVMTKNTLLQNLERYEYSTKEEKENTDAFTQDEGFYFLNESPSDITIHDALTDLCVSAERSLGEETYCASSYHLSLEKMMRLASVKDGLDASKEDTAEKGPETDEDLREGNP